MSVRVWQGGTGAASVAQVNAVTPANVGIGNTFTVTINGKSVTYTAAAATVADVTAGLVAALEASTEPEFTELTFSDETTHIEITGPDDGTPFTQTSSAGGGTATLTTATATAATSPNDWSLAANWSGNAVPVSTDDVIIDATDVSILYGLDQSAVTLTSQTVGSGFTGAIGLPTRNANGYSEYREDYLKIGSTLVMIGGGEGGGSGRIKLDTGAVQTTLTVLSTGSPLDAGLESVLWKGTHANSVVNVVEGSVGIAVLPGESGSNIDIIRVGGGAGAGASVRTGPTTGVPDIEVGGGDVTLAAGAGSLTMTGGTVTIIGGASVTLRVDGGTLNYRSVGTVTALHVSDGGTVDFGSDPRPRTITDCTLHAGATVSDPLRTVTWTNPITLQRCALRDVQLDFGTHLALDVAAGP